MFQSHVSNVRAQYECLMLMLMQCKSIYARLTPRVLHTLEQALCELMHKHNDKLAIQSI